MKDAALSALTQKHGAAAIVQAVNDAMEANEAQAAAVPRMTVRILYDLTSRGFRADHGVWLLAGLRRLGYSVEDAVEACPQLKPYADVVREVNA